MLHKMGRMVRIVWTRSAILAARPGRCLQNCSTRPLREVVPPEAAPFNPMGEDLRPYALWRNVYRRRHPEGPRFLQRAEGSRALGICALITAIVPPQAVE